jgi:hypothetical protein
MRQVCDASSAEDHADDSVDVKGSELVSQASKTKEEK